MKKPIPNPQSCPALALAQLLTEYPELPPIRWELAADGHLSGLSMCMTVDVRPVMAEYAAVLGGVPDDQRHEDIGVFTSWLYTIWRDVPVAITLGCDAELVAAPVSLPTAWSAAVSA